jgi:hypothetical protein
MVPPVIATVYPMPAAPGDRFPVYFVAYLLAGAGWYLYQQSRAASQ